jgi:hypothetical protein
MKRKQRPLAPRDPQRAAQHVAYELGMLRTIYGHLRGQNVVMLEGFLVHTRNLIEFFWDCAPKGAILPRDFGAPARRDKDPEIAELHDQISQLLSHLTWARVQVHEPQPPDLGYGRARSVYGAIAAKAEMFFQGLSAEHRGWFSSRAFPDEHRHWLR